MTKLVNGYNKSAESSDKPLPRARLHDLRHLHATSSEDGADRLFIQQQVGHRCDTSTAIYTHVSADFMNTALRKAISPAFDAPGSNGKEC